MSSTIQHRQHLHQIPELDDYLPKTIAYLTSYLKQYNGFIFSPMKGSICVYFSFQKPTTIAFRSDMDALPIQEKTNLPFASLHTQCMHACGHDGHMAMLLSLAQHLHQKPKTFHNILLIFQPKEETTGGAKSILETNLFSTYHVIATFGIHIWPNLDEHIIACKPKEAMATSSSFQIDIFGNSAHAANSAKKQDALACAVDFLTNMKQQQSNDYDPDTLLFFGSLHSGCASNIVSAHSKIEGTLRSLNETNLQQWKQKMTQQLTYACTLHNTTSHITIHSGYPILINDANLLAYCQSHIPYIQTLSQASFLTDDFSYYANCVPSLYFFLGMGNQYQLHTNTFQFPETILDRGVALYKQLIQLDYSNFASNTHIT